MSEWFDVVREACPPAIWSRGVALARDRAVAEESRDGDAVALRVVTRGGMVSHAVVLDTEFAEWECDCRGRDDPCEHVAAAAIALHRGTAKEVHAATPARAAPGRIRYQLRRWEGGLALEREIVSGQAVHLLTTTLEAIASGRVDGPPFAATHADLEVEIALGARRRGPMPRGVMPRLLRALAGCDDVRLDGQPVEASREVVTPLGIVEDAPGGFQLRVIPDPDIEERFSNGVLLYRGALRVLGESRLTGREWADLPEGRFYPHDRAVELVSEVLPSLESRIEVERRTVRLPAVGKREKPRLVLKVERDREGLSVLPLLVYGDPPRARVDAGRLVHLAGALPVRDEPAEQRLIAAARAELGAVPGRRQSAAGEDAVALAERLRAWRGDIDGVAHESVTRAPALIGTFSLNADDFGARFSSPSEERADAGEERADASAAAGSREVSAEAVLTAWRDAAGGVWLPSGGWAPLPSDWLERYGDVLSDLLAARDADGKLPLSSLPELAALCRDLDHPEPPELGALAPLLDEAGQIPEATLPEDLTGSLRAYQLRGVAWLAFLRDAGLGGLLADDMGLGKTLQTLCALEGRCLVVAPTSLLHNWGDEIERFRPGMRTCLYHGPNRRLDPEASVTLTSYALLRLDETTLSSVDWDGVVLDEAQAIKNADSQVARAAFNLRARYRFALTGTPVENRLDELWSQIHFANPGLLGGRRDFQQRYARPIANGETEPVGRLRRRIRPFVLRRLKRDVAPELPARTELVLHCALDEDERRVYEALAASTRKEVVEKLARGAQGSVMAALEALLRLRQAACHRGLIPGQEAASSSKVELLAERLEQAFVDGHRALVFSQWTSLLDRVEPVLRERAIVFDRLDGSTRDRAAVVRRFQQEDGAAVLLVSLRAGGAGLNLTAADHVFLLDPWWNPAVEDQAADRTHRIGQQRPVFIHRIVAEDTVEERILSLQARKRSLAEAALGEADAAASLGREELLELLS